MKTESMIAKKVREMKPSGIRVFFDLVLGMKDVISLGVGEPDHVTPWVIREAGITAIEQGYTSYTSNKGLMKLRLYIARHIQKETGVSYDPEEEILITVGVSEAVDLAMRALLDPGDRVLIPLPSYVSYGPTVELAGGIPVFIDTEKDGFRLTPKTLEKAIRPRTKALLLNYPNNPTGVTYTRKELNALKNVLLRHKILCISDEIYGDLTYDFKHTSFPSLPRAKPATLLLNGFSKGHAMTGWRIGYACGPAPLIAAMTKIHQYTILCPSIVSQMAACEALQSGKRAVAEMKRDYARRRRIVRDALERIGFEIAPPQGAFYAFASVRNTGLDAMEYAQRLLETEKVAVVPGTAFGEAYSHYIRISYASGADHLREAFSRMERFTKSLTSRRTT